MHLKEIEEKQSVFSDIHGSIDLTELWLIYWGFR